MEQEALATLHRQAVSLFGEERAEALRPHLEALATWLDLLTRHPPPLEEEPALILPPPFGEGDPT